jgi:hypothetical protein
MSKKQQHGKSSEPWGSVANQDICRQLVAREVHCHIGGLMDDLIEAKGPEYLDDNFTNLYRIRETLSDGAEWEGNDEDRAQKIAALKDELDEVNIAAGDIEDQIRESTDTAARATLQATLEKTEKQADHIQDDIDTLKAAESQPQEVFEWWAVSEYLADQLKAKGEVIGEIGRTHIWGRCAAGQAILLDGAIGQIAEDMEILAGQANDWSKQQ